MLDDRLVGDDTAHDRQRGLGRGGSSSPTPATPASPSAYRHTIFGHRGKSAITTPPATQTTRNGGRPVCEIRRSGAARVIDPLSQGQLRWNILWCQDAVVAVDLGRPWIAIGGDLVRWRRRGRL